MNRKSTINILSIPAIMIIFFILLQPEIAKLTPLINSIWKLLTLFVYIIIIFLYIKKAKISKIVLFFFLYYFFLFITTFLNNGNITYFFSANTSFLIILLYSEILIKNSPINFIKALFYLVVILLIINLFSIYQFPNGITEIDHYFLGLDNSYAITVIFSGIIMWIYCYLNKKNKIFTLLCLFLPFFILFKTNCSTGIVGSVLLLIGYFLMPLIKKIKLCNFKNYMLITALLTYGIVVLRLQEYFEFIIINLLGKNLTLTNRTVIWDSALHLIEQNPLFGVGHLVGHAHCTYLNITLQSGLIGLLIYVMILFFVNKKLKNYESSDIIKIISFGFFIYFIMTISEFYLTNYLFYVLIIFACYPQQLINIEKEFVKK